jgi:hypothetical protein
MTSIRLLMCIVLKVLNYYITLETLKNIRLLLLYLGFQAKRLLMRMKETLQYFGYSVKKTLQLDSLLLSFYFFFFFLLLQMDEPCGYTPPT